MSQNLVTLLVLSLLFVILCIVTAGCSTPAPSPAPQESLANGTIHVSSEPPGAEVFFNGDYSCPTPCTIPGTVPSGRHVLEFRKDGYGPVTYPVTMAAGGREGVFVTLVHSNVTLPVPIATTAASPVGLPEIHIDGYWTYLPGRSSTENPVPLVVHTDAFNVGTADAREVTASANLYYKGRMVCHDTVYLGTLTAGGHVSRDILITCTLPSTVVDSLLEVRLENAVVTE